MDMDKKTNVLWISLMAPYDNVKHASGKIENFFLKNLHRTGKFNIHLISFATEAIRNEIDLDKYGISNSIFYYSWTTVQRLVNAYGKLNIWSKSAGLTSPFYAKMVLKEISQLKESGYTPDIIILDWTEMATILEDAKAYFPNAKIVMIEEDVSFLGHSRKADAAHGIKKVFLSEKARRIKHRELELLNKSDLIILNNHKDEKLILDEVSPGKIWVWCPFYQTMLDRPRKPHNNDIIFYGALSRVENWKSAVWFLENVWPRIKNKPVRFVMIGSNPPDVLRKYESDQVLVTGFVDEIYPYFEESLCLVAPLVLGAGVKIKILEGLSSGIPVLTNDIGIEGIPAKNGTEYFHCVSADEYVEIIDNLLSEKLDFRSIEINSKNFMRRTFNFEKDSMEFANRLQSLVL